MKYTARTCFADICWFFRSVIDKWYKSKDKESLVMARKLIRKEGLLCGKLI